jgi:hypothetical protein
VRRIRCRLARGCSVNAKETLDYITARYVVNTAKGTIHHIGGWRGARKRGVEAGYLHDSGYRMICVAGRMTYTHRIVWLFHYQSWPVGVIDHVNRCRSDNRICNLRDVSVSANNMNRSPSADSYPGVGLDRTHRTFKAYFRPDSGKRINIGTYKSYGEACRAHVRALVERMP